MGVKSVSRKVFCVLAAITVALAASFLWGGEQAHADGKPVARLLNYEHREIRTYENLQDAFGEVKNGQTIQLIRDVETDKEFTINRGMDNSFTWT